jgi:hypothetical protein
VRAKAPNLNLDIGAVNLTKKPYNQEKGTLQTKKYMRKMTGKGRP